MTSATQGPDIVERLHAIAAKGTISQFAPIAAESADEILRLRAEVERLKCDWEGWYARRIVTAANIDARLTTNREDAAQIIDQLRDARRKECQPQKGIDYNSGFRTGYQRGAVDALGDAIDAVRAEVGRGEKF